MRPSLLLDPPGPAPHVFSAGARVRLLPDASGPGAVPWAAGTVGRVCTTDRLAVQGGGGRRFCLVIDDAGVTGLVWESDMEPAGEDPDVLLQAAPDLLGEVAAALETACDYLAQSADVQVSTEDVVFAFRRAALALRSVAG